MEKTKLAIAGLAFVAAVTVASVLLKTEDRTGTTVSSVVVVSNETSNDATVYVSFGSASVVLPKHWAFCKPTSELTCEFPLKANGSRSMPLSGHFLNATIAFNAPVGCGSTKAELSLNDPAWYDTADISLVDGWNADLGISADGTKLGPTKGNTGNELVLGVFPLGCDICVARQLPPCGIPTGTDGCKKGTQYNPEVPCQWQGTKMGGGSTIRISLVASSKP